MGAGIKRWWRDMSGECRAWDNRDVERRYWDEGYLVTVYKNGSVVILDARHASKIVCD